MKLAFRFLLIVLFVSCGQPKETTSETEASSLNFKAIAAKIIEQADLHADEKVLLVINPGRFDPLVEHLRNEIESKDAVYMGTESLGKSMNPEWNTDYIKGMQRISGAMLRDYLSEIDLGIMLPGATPIDIVYDGLQKVLKSGSGRTIHFHWQGAYDLNGNAIEPDSTMDQFYQRVLFNTDYAALAAKQLAFEEAMRNNWIRVTTPAGTDIKFQIGDRQVTRQDGNASMARMQTAKTLIDREIELPAGAIRVAPVEESVDGVIVFPDANWSGEMAKDVRITIQQGKVKEVIASENLAAVQKELTDGGEAAEYFREFALGFNPLLAIPNEEPWIPYYGYGAGVVRLSLGDNSELGGNVRGGYVRWNFFTDATVTVGDEVWVQDGKLIK